MKPPIYQAQADQGQHVPPYQASGTGSINYGQSGQQTTGNQPLVTGGGMPGPSTPGYGYSPIQNIFSMLFQPNSGMGGVPNYSPIQQIFGQLFGGSGGYGGGGYGGYGGGYGGDPFQQLFGAPQFQGGPGNQPPRPGTYPAQANQPYPAQAIQSQPTQVAGNNKGGGQAQPPPQPQGGGAWM